jgi:hypothetical protein
MKIPLRGCVSFWSINTYPWLKKKIPYNQNWKNLPGNCEMILPKQKFFFGWN